MTQTCEVEQLKRHLLETIRTRGSLILQEALVRSNKRLVDLTCQIATSEELLRVKEADLKMKQTEVNKLEKTFKVSRKELENIVRRLERISDHISGAYYEEHFGINLLCKENEKLALEIEELEKQIQVMENFQRHLGIHCMGRQSDGDTVFKFCKIYPQGPENECYLRIRNVQETGSDFNFDGVLLHTATKNMNNILKQKAQEPSKLSNFLRCVYEILKNSSDAEKKDENDSFPVKLNS